MKSKIVKILLFLGAAFVFLKGGMVLYRFYFQSGVFGQDEEPIKRMSFSMVVDFHPKGQKDGGYGFGRMIALIDACQKVKYMEHLYFTKATDNPPVPTQTIRDLIKAIAQEREKFRRYLDLLKSQAAEPTTTRRVRSLSYYLQVLEENIQDLSVIVAGRSVPATKK